MGEAQSEGVAWVTTGLLDGVCGRETLYAGRDIDTQGGEQHIGKGNHLCTGHTWPGDLQAAV